MDCICQEQSGKLRVRNLLCLNACDTSSMCVVMKDVSSHSYYKPSFYLNACRPVDDEENITDGDPDIIEDGEAVSDVDFDSDDSDDSDSDDSDSDDSEGDQE